MNARITAQLPLRNAIGDIFWPSTGPGDIDTRPDGADRVHLVMKCLEETGLFNGSTEARGQFSGIRWFKTYRQHHKTGMEYLEGTGLAVFGADLDLVSMSRISAGIPGGTVLPARIARWWFFLVPASPRMPSRLCSRS